MTPEQRDRVFAMVRGEATEQDVLDVFGASNGSVLGSSLLREALLARDDVGVEVGMIVSFKFGFVDDHFPIMLELARADWHQRHEDVASVLDWFHRTEGVESLCWLTQWVPDYLDFDDARALAIKAVWGLGNTAGEASSRALRDLLCSDNEIVRNGAREQLERRGELL